MLDMERIPTHVAIVMDGNGRWADQRRLPKMAGHNAGMKAMKEIVKRASTLGIKNLTVYAFSTENWKRSAEEIGGIFKLIVLYVDSELRELHENNVKVRILGDYSMLPQASVERIDRALSLTKDNTGMQFNIALNYGGRDDIRRAASALAEQCVQGTIAPEDITEERIGEYLWTGGQHAGCGDPELVIRTSGEQRLSNFLLWQCAYSEFVFTDTLWPDFTPEKLEEAISEYQGRNRRFGGR